MIWTPPKTWVKADNINVPDWQRIDDNTRWIAEFYGVTLPYKIWQHTDFPTPSELSRIESNINLLLDETHVFQTKFDWSLLNDIESLLLAMHAKVVELQLSVRRSGTFVSGQETYIPLGGT